MNIKNIHIGELIQKRADEMQISIRRISEFMGCDEEEINKMYQCHGMEVSVLLRWSMLLKYDFFRIYTGHLILYAPSSKTSKRTINKQTQQIFRKNIYTHEVKNFIMEKIFTNQMTVQEVIHRYRIPKTTLYKWLKKV